MYPLPLSSDSARVAPLFGTALEGPPHVFDFSSRNPRADTYDPSRFFTFQKNIIEELAAHEKKWGVGKYLEERAYLLRFYPQMIREKRFYHAGLDITAPAGTPVYAPLDAEVFEVGKEEGIGNYGGFVVLRHGEGDEEFYSFYGHLLSRHEVRKGQKLAAGERFASIGDGEDSGGWFTHTHLQILTPRAIKEGKMMTGYIAESDLPLVESYFPSPYSLLRY